MNTKQRAFFVAGTNNAPTGFQFTKSGVPSGRGNIDSQPGTNLDPDDMLIITNL